MGLASNALRQLANTFESAFKLESDMKPTERELLNAGFTKEFNNIFVYRYSDATIKYDNEECSLNVAAIDFPKNSFNYNTTAETKEELNKILYAFLKKDLDFSDPAYTWNTCFNGEGFFIDDESDVMNSECISKDADNYATWKHQSHAHSAISFARLSYVVDEVNKYFPKKTSKDQQYRGFCPMWNEERGEFVAGAVQRLDILKIWTESEEGCKILIRDNKSDLLDLYCMG